MRRALTALALAAALALAGCGEAHLDHGRVVGKVHEPERNYTILVPIITGEICNGKSCTPLITPIPFYEHDGEDWKLELRDGKHAGVAYVTRAIYEHEVVGDYFDVRKHGRYAATSDDNNSRRRKG
jgi:hypothetical protein